jgi:2'-5' RNA ligase
MRAFVAVNLPHVERSRLYDTLEPLRAEALPVRWMPPESLHLTLKFLGRVEDERVAALHAMLVRIARVAEPFELAVGGLGAFPRLGRPRVWWVGIAPEPRLTTLQRALDAGLVELGFAREDRPFSPHVTIGRAREDRSTGGSRVEAVVASFAFRFRFAVETIDLMESQLSPRGARYVRMCAAPLGGAALASRKNVEVS